MKNDHVIKFYIYGFLKKDREIIIEAYSQEYARKLLCVLLIKLRMPGYSLKTLCNEKVKVPLIGVTKKTVDGQQYIWTEAGWEKKKIQPER